MNDICTYMIYNFVFIVGVTNPKEDHNFKTPERSSLSGIQFKRR